jgi:hypothetical protein
MGDFGLNFFAIVTTAGICVIVWALRKLEDRVDVIAAEIDRLQRQAEEHHG